MKSQSAEQIKPYSMVFSFFGDATVAIAPVEGNLLFLLFIQPDEFLSRLWHKVVQAFQVALLLSGMALKGTRIQRDDTIENRLKNNYKTGIDHLPKVSHTASLACWVFRNKSALKVGSSETEEKILLASTTESAMAEIGHTDIQLTGYCQ